MDRSEMEMREQFLRLLPWLVNGTLGEEQRDWVQRYVLSHPDAAKDVRELQSLRRCLRDPSQLPTADAGWDKLRSRMRGSLRRRVRPSRPSHLAWWVSLEQMLTHWLTPQAFGMVAGLLIAQGMMIGFLLQRAAAQGQPPPHVSRPAVGAAGEPVSPARFNDVVPGHDIRQPLYGLPARAVGGPAPSGNDFLAVAPKAIDASVTRPREANGVQQAAAEAVAGAPRPDSP